MLELQLFEERDPLGVVPIVLRTLGSIPGRFQGRTMLNASAWFARPATAPVELLKLADAAADDVARLIGRDRTSRAGLVPRSPVGPKTPILFIAANPSATSHLQLDIEAREVQRALPRTRHRGSFVLHTRWAARPGNLIEALHELKPAIVHVSGHGSSDGLFFEDDRGQLTLVSADALATMFQAAGQSVRLVVLDAVSGESYAARLAKHVEYVIGIGDITDEVSRYFAAAFYGALANGNPVGRAFETARHTVAMAGLPHQPSLVLYTRHPVDANETTFF